MGKTAENWDWRSQGVVLFLGGDQFFSVVIAKRLGYRTVVYAEWEARWHQWVDRFGVMREDIATRAAQKYAHKFTVVGDLMAEVGRWSDGENSTFNIHNSKLEPLPHSLIGILPGSKPMKLTLECPYCWRSQNRFTKLVRTRVLLFRLLHPWICQPWQPLVTQTKIQ